MAALLPVLVVLAPRIKAPPSQLLLPLAFAAHAGGLLALTGSPVNVIVSDASADAGEAPFGFFEFAAVGLPLLVATLVICLATGPRLLPTRPPTGATPDLSRHAETLAGHYVLDDGFYRLRLSERSSLVGRTVAEVDLSPYDGLFLVGVQPPPAGALRRRDERLALGDTLVVTGPAKQVSHLVVDERLGVGMSPLPGGSRPLIDERMGVVEVVVPPRSPLGEAFFPGMARGSDLVVLAVRRLDAERGPRPTELEEGDSLLLHGSWSAIEALGHDRDVLVVDEPELVRRQALPLGQRAWAAGLVLVGLVALLALTSVPPAIAGLAAAVAMVVLRVLSAPQAYRAVSWQTVVLIGGLIPLSAAIQDSGAADLVAGWLTAAVGEGRPYLLLVALFVLTATLGQVVSNTATVLVVAPIAVAAAVETGVSVRPVLLTVAVAGAASFLTPVATPANMMVMGPAGYRFGDYWRLGIVLMVAWLAVALLVIPLVWPL